MKILYLHQHFRRPEESGGTRSYEFAKRWAAAGHQVHIVTTRQSGSDAFRGWREGQVAGIHVHELFVSYSNVMGFYRRIRAFLEFALGACSRATSIGGDVVFATSTPLTIALPGMWASWRLRVPMVFEVRDLWPEVPIAMGVIRNPILIWLSRKLERLAYRCSAYIIALSPDMAASIVEVEGCREKVFVIPNASDTSLFDRDVTGHFLRDRPELHGRRIVLYAGTIGDVNGLGYLLDIAREMTQHDLSVAFVIVGEGRQRRQLEERAHEEKLAGKNVFLYPPVPKQEMPDVLGACEASISFVQNIAALAKNSANKVFDTLAAGRPIVINHRGWLAELIQEHDIGLVLPCNDPKTAAEMLSDFLSSPLRLREVGERARRLARSTFDRERLADDALTVLKRARHIDETS